MSFDGIVTKIITTELENLSGARIDKIFQPDKNTIVMGVYLAGTNYSLNICIDSQNYSINLTTHTRTNPKVAPNFCMLLRKYLIGMHIKNFVVDNLERVIIIELEGFDDINDIVSLKLIVELMGKHSNILLVDEQNRIIDCLRHIYPDDSREFKTRNLLPKYSYTPPFSDKINFLELTNFDEFKSILERNYSSGKNLSNILTDTFHGFSKIFIDNVLNTLGINDYKLISTPMYFDSNSKGELNHSIIRNNPSNNLHTSTAVKFLNTSQLEKIYSYLNDIIYCSDTSLLDFKPIFAPNHKLINYVLVKNSSKNSFKDLDNFSTVKIVNETFRLNFFLDDFYFHKESQEKFITYRNSLLKLILDTLKKYNKRLANMNHKLEECDDMEKYRIYGELITANLYRIENKNINCITVENYYDNNNLVDIPLDPKYSPSVNAKRFFKKYNKLKNALAIVGIQKKETLDELNYIESIVYELESCSSLDELSEIYEEISENIIFKEKFLNSPQHKKSNKKLKKSNLTKNKTVSFNPVKYIIDGYTVLIGRNNKENDYLTLKFANKNDIWFHTQDIHGSHVILKLDHNQSNHTARNNNSNQTSLSMELLKKIASIAAFYSKGKNSSYVPVDYCEVKYVKKPSGSKPGMVIYTHQHTLNVAPNLPNC